MEGLHKFMKDLSLNMETAESLIGFFELGFSSFWKVSYAEFETAMISKNANSV